MLRLAFISVRRKHVELRDDFPQQLRAPRRRGSKNDGWQWHDRSVLRRDGAFQRVVKGRQFAGEFAIREHRLRILD